MGTGIQTAQRRRTLTKQSRRFTLALFSLILVLSAGVFPIIDRLYIMPKNKYELLDSVSNSLDLLALNRARMIDPEYNWIEITEDVSPSIENGIKESVNPMNNTIIQEMAQDTNLAWKISYNGKEYRHNWNDAFDAANGFIDYSITSDGTRARYSGETLPNSLNGMLSSLNQAIVNPALASDQQTEGSSNSSVKNSYNYRLLLPQDFSIRFYIPQQLAANGGLIARITQSFSYGAEAAAACVSSAVLLLFVFLYKKKPEMESSLVMKLTKIKALGALLLFPAALVFGGWGVFGISSLNATGELQQVMISAGFGPVWARGISFLTVFACWFVLLTIEALTLLYVKYMFTKGFKRFLIEDTVIATGIRSLERSLKKTVASPLSSYTIRRAIPLIALLCLLIVATIAAAGSMFGLAGILIAGLIDTIFVCLLAYRILKIAEEDFNRTLAAARQLAEGSFDTNQPINTGIFQPLSDALLKVQASYQKALEDGLSLQISKTQLISNVSHDLKTPVTGIQSYAELIRLSDDPNQIRKYAGRLENYSHRLARLIEDLFDVAKATSGDIRLEPVALDLTEMIYQVGGEWEDELKKKDLTIVYTLPDAAPAMLDPDKTMRIIDNLLSNIRKYSMEGSRVFVALEKIPGQYRAVFKNTSKTPLNFEPEEIVERFVRGDRSRHEAGSGLGLAIVKSFMEVQQGSFTVEIDGDLFKAILVFPALSIPEHPKPALPMPAAGQNSEQNTEQENSSSLQKFPENAVNSTEEITKNANPDTLSSNDAS